MNVEIGAEAALFPEKEYINGIFIAVRGEFGDFPAGDGKVANLFLHCTFLHIN
jgi:hypothetical protein